MSKLMHIVRDDKGKMFVSITPMFFNTLINESQCSFDSKYATLQEDAVFSIAGLKIYFWKGTQIERVAKKL
jgi:hypothetical protein